MIGEKLIMPVSQACGEGYIGKERSQFRGCHNYNINSLSISKDGETFLSADDLRINLWNFENNVLAFNVVDLKPGNIEDLSEVITHV
jgi:serine/threonine-protein phosphatase 2A regulatory subunit B